MSAVAPVWSPTEQQARQSRLWRFMQRHGCASYPELCRRAAEDEFSVDLQVRRYVELYEQVLAEA